MSTVIVIVVVMLVIGGVAFFLSPITGVDAEDLFIKGEWHDENKS